MADDAAGSTRPFDGSSSPYLLRFLTARLAEAAVTGYSVGIREGWRIAVEVMTEVGSEVGELVLSIELPSTQSGPPINRESVARAKEIMACFGSVPPTGWHIAPSDRSLRIHCQVKVADLDSLLTLTPTEGAPAGSHAHIVRETELVQSLVDGHVVRSMCGHVFVPTETGDQTRARPVCPRCTLVIALAKAVVD